LPLADTCAIDCVIRNALAVHHTTPGRGVMHSQETRGAAHDGAMQRRPITAGALDSY